MKARKDVSFSESEVREWCGRSDDSNPLHLNEQAAVENELYEERIVPGVMLLDHVSGLITTWSESKDGTPVLSRMSGIDFKNPVPFNKTVTISVEEEDFDVDEEMYVLAFHVFDGEMTFVHGTATVYLL